MEKKKNLVSIIVCTKDRHKDLEKNLKSLSRQTYRPIEILVIDKSFGVETKNLCKKYKNVKYFRQKGSGLPNARNFALKKAKGEIIIFLDDDCTVNKNYVKEIVNGFKKLKNAGGLAGRVFQKSYAGQRKGVIYTLGKIYYKFFGISGIFITLDGIHKVLPTGFTTLNWDKIKKTEEVDWIGGCGMSYPIKVIEDVGNFNEQLIGNAYYEDVEYSYRVKKAGYKLYILRKATIKHFITPVSRDSFPKLKYYQLYNQKILFKSCIYDGTLLQLLKHKLAHLALFLPFLICSIYYRNLEILKAYFCAELGLKY
ncbi:MAG: glycosyltransferase [Candidatus Methanomethylicia archaeon]